MSKIHYALCDHPTESDNNEYWSEFTACGLSVDENDLDLIDKKQYVSCKNCIKVLNKQTTTTDE